MDLQGTLNQLAGTSGVDAQGAAAILAGTATALADEGLVAADVAQMASFNFFALASEALTTFGIANFPDVSSPHLLFDDTTDEGVQLITKIPNNWATYRIYALGQNVNGASGTVRFQTYETTTPVTGTTVNPADGAFAIDVLDLGTSTAVTFSGHKMALPAIVRDADHAGDTMVGDYALLAAWIEKAS